MTKVIGLQEFKNLGKDIQGVFAFLNTNACPFCSDYMEVLNNHDTSEWTIIKIKKEDEEWFFKNEFIHATPVTRVYYKGKVVLDKKGLLYKKQYEDITTFVKEMEI